MIIQEGVLLREKIHQRSVNLAIHAIRSITNRHKLTMDLHNTKAIIVADIKLCQ